MSSSDENSNVTKASRLYSILREKYPNQIIYYNFTDDSDLKSIQIRSPLYLDSPSKDYRLLIKAWHTVFEVLIVKGDCNHCPLFCDLNVPINGSKYFDDYLATLYHEIDLFLLVNEETLLFIAKNEYNK